MINCDDCNDCGDCDDDHGSGGDGDDCGEAPRRQNRHVQVMIMFDCGAGDHVENKRVAKPR